MNIAVENIATALLLHKKYENRELKLSDITDEEYENIEKVYYIQMYQIEEKIRNCKKNVEEYKNKILKYKKEINES